MATLAPNEPETEQPAAVPAVRLSGIRRAYGDVVAVAGVDLDIGAGEFFTLLGPSGSGKTTYAGLQETVPGFILDNIRQGQQLPVINVVAFVVIVITAIPVALAQRVIRDTGVIRRGAAEVTAAVAAGEDNGGLSKEEA